MQPGAQLEGVGGGEGRRGQKRVPVKGCLGCCGDWGHRSSLSRRKEWQEAGERDEHLAGTFQAKERALTGKPDMFRE